ncbi:MAG TPA: hypothetical protein PKK94_23175, partial [Leptospiraceae bacterium]|nr:hypothetical protein [Leptospiraceae bacterium]
KKYRVEKHFGKKPDSGFYEVPDPAMDQYLVLDESLYGTGDTHLYYHVRPADVSVSGASPKALPGWRDNRNYRYQAGASGETVISYYFWYDYNEGPTSFGNSHEGDLESFAVLLDRSGKPKLFGKVVNQDPLKVEIKIYKTSDNQSVLNILFDGTKEQFYDLFTFIPEKINPELSPEQKKLIEVFSTKQYAAIEPYAKANFIEKDADKKIQLLTQSLTADPEYQPALRELASAYNEKGDSKKALETYIKCREKMEKNQLQNTAAYARTLGNLVEYYSKTNDRKAYIAAFKQYLEAGEKTGIGISQGLFDFGVFLHMKEGKSCEGLVYLEKLAKQPDVKDFELNDFSNLLTDVRELCRK